jgi:hypothetical protein
MSRAGRKRKDNAVVVPVEEFTPSQDVVAFQRVPADLSKRPVTQNQDLEHRKPTPFVKAKAPRGVTLAPFTAWDKHDGVVRDRDAQKRSASSELQRATEERLQKASGATVGSDRVQRLADAFDRLHAKSLLDKDNAAVNEMLWRAGLQYRHHYHCAALSGIAAMDLTKDIVDGSGHADAESGADSIAHHREKVRAANVVIGLRCCPFFLGVVMHEQSAAELRHMVRETKDRNAADALVLDRLREALHRLADLYQMKPNDRARMRHWRDC